MYFNILQTLVMAAVIYFVACWLLSRLAEWLPERMQQRTAAPAEPEPVAPIAIMDPSNVNQIAVAKEVKELPLGGTPRKYHVHHRGTNASIRNWRRTRYEQGYDETHPESQVDPATGEFPAARKAAEDDKAAKAKAARAKRKAEAEAAADADDRHADKTAHHTDAMPERNPVFKHGNDVGKGRTDLGGKPKI